MAENTSPGFVIPQAVPAPGRQQPLPPSQVPGGPAGNAADGGIAVPEAVPAGPEPRDYAITGLVLIILIVAFLFARNAYSNHLARRRVPPGAAAAAGWWLFVLLTALGIAAALVILDPAKFLVPLFMIPLGIIGIVAAVLMAKSGRRS